MCPTVQSIQMVDQKKRFLATIVGWKKRDKSSPQKNKSEKKAPPLQKKTKIYEVFMSMNYHSFSLWSPASRSEVWLHVTVAESAGLSWWIQPATSAVRQHMCTLLRTKTHEYRGTKMHAGKWIQTHARPKYCTQTYSHTETRLVQIFQF